MRPQILDEGLHLSWKGSEDPFSNGMRSSNRKDGSGETGTKEVLPSLLIESLRQYSSPTALEVRVGFVVGNNGLNRRGSMNLKIDQRKVSNLKNSK